MDQQRFVAKENLACRILIGGHLIILFVSWLALSAIALGNDETTNGEFWSTSADVTQLVEQLGADSFSLRERASNELLARGFGAYAELQDAESHPDREIRMRVRRLLVSLIEIDR